MFPSNLLIPPGCDSNKQSANDRMITENRATDECIGMNNLSYKSLSIWLHSRNTALLYLIDAASLFLFKAVSFQIETSLLVKLLGFWLFLAHDTNFVRLLLRTKCSSLSVGSKRISSMNAQWLVEETGCLITSKIIIEHKYYMVHLDSCLWE